MDTPNVAQLCPPSNPKKRYFLDYDPLALPPKKRAKNVPELTWNPPPPPTWTPPPPPTWTPPPPPLFSQIVSPQPQNDYLNEDSTMSHDEPVVHPLIVKRERVYPSEDEEQPIYYNAKEWIGKTPKQFVMEYFQLKKYNPSPRWEKSGGGIQRSHAVEIMLPEPLHGRSIFATRYTYPSLKEAEHNVSLILLVHLVQRGNVGPIAAEDLKQALNTLFEAEKSKLKRDYPCGPSRYPNQRWPHRTGWKQNNQVYRQQQSNMPSFSTSQSYLHSPQMVYHAQTDKLG